jgi:UDP-N-acetylglucosamine 2-epimerase (non-hydrolysing)
MKIAIVVGTRPEVVKMAPVIRAAEAAGASTMVLHSGQHYSSDMSAVFFAELDLPAPRVNLAVGSGSHPVQIGTMLLRLEEVLETERPDIVLVEGDTNTVLAAGLTANKMGIRVGHVEAGLRSGDRTMPEEINRIIVDHFADELYAPTGNAAANLRGEGIADERVVVTGNTVVDEVLRALPMALELPIHPALPNDSAAYLLATVHRAENTDSAERLRGIVQGLERARETLGALLLLPLHPRTAARLREHEIDLPAGVTVIQPVGYLESIALQARAALVLTDSGGLQEEACTLGVPCVTLRDNTERPETIEAGSNQLAGADPDEIVGAALTMIDRRHSWTNPFGDGHSGERIIANVMQTQRVAIPVEDAPDFAAVVS